MKVNNFAICNKNDEMKGTKGMAERINWSDSDLIKIWYYRWQTSVGECPYKYCEYRHVNMQLNNYGDQTATSWVVDHIKPISKGGRNELTNLQPMHNKCNQLKGDSYY